MRLRLTFCTLIAALSCAVALTPASAAPAAAGRPKVQASFPVPIIFTGDMPDLAGLITDRTGLARVRITWGQGAVSTWRWQDSPSERVVRLAPMDAVSESFYYQDAGQYTVKVVATNRRGRSTTKTLRITVEAYSPEREQEICSLYDCGPVDTDPEVGPDGF